MSDDGPSIRGELLPSQFAGQPLAEMFGGRLGEESRAGAARRFARWWRLCQARTGPTTSLRSLIETSAAPMFAILGFRLDQVLVDPARGRALARGVTPGHTAVPVLVARWSDDLERHWRDAVREGISAGSPWTLCWNARELRVVDSARPWGRRDVCFDLERCATDGSAFAVLWGLTRATALEPGGSRAPTSHLAGHHGRQAGARTRRGVVGHQTLLEEIVQAAARDSASVCSGLERGVTEALVLLSDAFAGSLPVRALPRAEVLLDQSLTVIYRLLFLLFAEARALVPIWHRTYRESYSIEALREALEREPAAPGLWRAVQAISRLAHLGCRVGTLRVTPFNGHLFAPHRAPLAERAVVHDHVLRRVIEALTTTTTRRRRPVRIAFSDLGVEQLGAIYERVLDHRLVIEATRATGRVGATGAGARRPAVDRPLPLRRTRLVGSRTERRASATFYTPHALSDLIVRRTLGPLVDGARTEAILRLRVLDPAMGSGAFLVAACRYLARAYEGALVAEQQLRNHEIDERDRAGFRRLIARRCLYGIDVNPMAVQLARLSLWLATLAADVPLTFLDHHLRAGNSLIGASLADLLRQAPGRRRGRTGPPAGALPLLASTEAFDALDAAISVRLRLADLPDDTVDQVHQKEILLSSLEARGAPLSRWRDAADLWCAAWFSSEEEPAAPRALYGELLSATLHRGRSLDGAVLDPLLEAVRTAAARERFFHWTLEFPEVFGSGQIGGGSDGFDAVIGNPPWNVLRRDPAGPDGEPRRLAAFVREGGVFAGAADAHVNVYLLFVERALQLLRNGGRLGMVLPWGLAGDQGAAHVRRTLLECCHLDSCLAIDNRRGLFPIHRSLKLLVITGTRGRPTPAVPLRHLAGDAAALDACPERPVDDRPPPILIPREFLEVVSPGTLAVPDLRSMDELRLLDRLWRSSPALSSPSGWQARFGRELNASDDRALFRDEPPGLVLLEGKHIDPFRIRADPCHRYVSEAAARRRLPSAPFARQRLAYRDVASATNQRTLIAAVVPAGAITTHTLFCCRTPADAASQMALCALLNSFVANWLVRRWVSTHVTVSLVERLPVPGSLPLTPVLRRLGRLARALSRTGHAGSATTLEGRLQALCAHIWAISRDELALILEDFPLVDVALTRATLAAFDASVTPVTRGGAWEAPGV